MRFLRLGATLAVALAALAVITTAVRAGDAQPSTRRIEAPNTRAAQGVGFTRVQTVTLLPSQVATATNLTTLWESLWIGIADNIPTPLPADFVSLTVVGDYQLILNSQPFTTSFNEVFTNSILITPTINQKAFLSYYTDSRAERAGNQFRIVIHASSPETSSFQSSVVFSNSLYGFVSFVDGPFDTLPLGPPGQTTGRVWWGPVTVKGPTGADSGDKFDKDVVLADKRLLLDLAVKSYGVKMSGDSRSVQVTATVVNSGSVATGSQFVVELYDRPSSAGAPSGPTDHKWGICPETKDCNYSDYRFANAKIISGLAPSQTASLTFNYTFSTGGNRKLYLQVDTFGSDVGLNLEPGGGEANNVTFLGVYKAVGKLLIPHLFKN